MDAAALTRTLELYLADHPHATVAEEDEVVFELPAAHYSVSGDHGKCLLHIWSSDSNMVRRVLDAEQRKSELTLTIQKFGASQQTTLHLMPSGETAVAGTRAAERIRYRQRLKRVLQREFPTWKVDRLTSATDLEHSFGSVYVRGVMHRGQSAIAVVGVAPGELQPAIDGALTTGLLWLSAVREQSRQWTQGLTLIVPAGASAVLRARMAWVATGAGRLSLHEYSDREDTLREMDCSDAGNIETRLVRHTDPQRIQENFANAIARVRDLLPEADLSILSSTEVAFRYRGLQFMHSRMTVVPNSFRRTIESTFGLGAEETLLSDDTTDQLAALVEHIRQSRQGTPRPKDPLWRMTPERWLESLVIRDVAALDPRLDPHFVYSQVPAFSASDRAMIDVLTCTRSGRLAVVELKASEDFHLPLQGLDYWSRVKWHNERGEFQKYGYFAGREISPEPPLLFLVAPALHIHPETDTLLKSLSSEVDWELIALDEHWREELKVVFRKRRSEQMTR